MKNKYPAKKLTRAQKKVINALREWPGSFLVLHKKITDTVVFRLLKSNRSPVINFRRSVVEKLISLEIIERASDGMYLLKDANIENN